MSDLDEQTSSEWLERLKPLDRRPGAPVAQAVHARLRALVLDGTIPPEAEINQVGIAQRLGLSRTPVREAVRMLQEEGLVDAEPWKRARVIRFSPAHLESVYTQRIMLEGLGTLLTVPKMTSVDHDTLHRLVDGLNDMSDDAGRGQRWNLLHNEFHLSLVAATSPQLQDVISTNFQRAAQFRSLYRYRGPLPSFQHHGEHERIVQHCSRGDATAAAFELAEHLARTALSLIGQLAPAYSPDMIRAALDRFRPDHAPEAASTPRP